MQLTDAHCHLIFGELRDQADEAWDRARTAGVGRAIVVGIDPQSSADVIAFCAEREGLHPTVGVHPNEAGKQDDAAWERFQELAADPRVVALGESGVDLYWKDASLEDQRLWLERQAGLAIERDLPLVLHIRDAFPEAREILAPFAQNGLRAQVHCFTGGPEELEPFLEWGFSISYSGIVTFPNAKKLREAARLTPVDRILVETDAPWLAPAPHRGSVNEPAYVTHVARCIAELHGLEAEALARITEDNCERLFRFAERR